MLILTTISLAVVIAVQPVRAPAPEPGGFERGATMVLRLEHTTGPPCELTATVHPPALVKGSAAIVLMCNDRRADRMLTERESTDFLRLARASTLYATKGIGRDGRGGHLFFTTLKVEDAGAIVILVVSGNPEFGSGPRREFLTLLTQWFTELRPRVARISKAP